MKHPTNKELKAVLHELNAKRWEWTSKAYADRERGRAEAAMFDMWVADAYQDAHNMLAAVMEGDE